MKLTDKKITDALKKGEHIRDGKEKATHYMDKNWQYGYGVIELLHHTDTNDITVLPLYKLTSNKWKIVKGDKK